MFLDIVLDRLAADGPSAREARGLYEGHDPGGVVDPREDPAARATATLRTNAIDRLVPWWTERLAGLVRAGAAGFRLVGLDPLSGDALQKIIGATRRQAPCGFWAWTPGLNWSRHADLAGIGFDGVFASTAWWDGRAAWYVEEHELLRRIAPVIGLVEAPMRTGALDVGQRLRALRLAAATGDGLMMPAGFETDLEAEVKQATREVGCLSSFGAAGPMRRLNDASAEVTVLARLDAGAGPAAQNGVVVLINNDPSRPQPIPVSLDPLDPAAGALLGKPRTIDGGPPPDRLAAGEVCLVLVSRIAAVRESKRQDRRAASAAALRPPVVIERVTPQVSGGPFAAKRIIGRPIAVEADIFADGHDVLAAELLWQAADEKDWQRAPLAPIGNDRWRGALLPKRIGRHLFMIEAWRDEYATLCHALEVKHRAGIDVATEIADARAHLVRLKLEPIVAALSAGDVDQNVDPADRQPKRAAASPRPTIAPWRNRSEPIAVEVERPQAGFASWYELFPRSQIGDPARHGTFDDVIARLPRDPRHGLRRALFPADPSDRHAPTARAATTRCSAGAGRSRQPLCHRRAGGRPRRDPSRSSARSRTSAAGRGGRASTGWRSRSTSPSSARPTIPGCSEHPDWFDWRPDGIDQLRREPAEEIRGHRQRRFLRRRRDARRCGMALRDVVLFWIDQGVRIFRVDNPHTKPLPFWEWMIADIRGRHPDVIFLAEAFTRPKMM